MFKFYILIFLFINFVFSAHAKYEKSDPISIKTLKSYNTCKFKNIKKKNWQAVNYNTTIYLPLFMENKKRERLKCNQILEKLINNVDQNLDFKKLINEAISNNASNDKNLYINIYLKYNRNILANSDDFDTIKKHLDDIENNYLKKSDLNINQTAISVVGTLGWYYYKKKDFIDDDKALDYLTRAANFHKSNWNLGFYYNNLGVIYDSSERFFNPTARFIKKNNEIAFEYYKKGARLGNHYAHDNISKFYILGLGGVKKNYEKAIKHLKLGRVSRAGDNQFIDLALLYKKKKLPNNINEYLSWYEDYIIKNQDYGGFQQLAWLNGEKFGIKDQGIGVKKEIYKWHYLCTKYCEKFSNRRTSETEMHIIKNRFLSAEQVTLVKLDAKKWEDKNWNKPIDKLAKEELEEEKKKDKTLTDIIRNAFRKK